MKQTSIDKLTQVYNWLKAEGQTCRAELLMDILRAEAEPKADKSKFNIYDFVSKDTLRPIMCGVFYDGEWRVASDTHILIAEKGEWPKDLIDKIVGKDGAIIEGTYPRWRSIFPKDMAPYKAHKIDREKFESIVKELRLQYKAENGKGCKWGEWYMRVGPAVFKAEFLWKMMTTGMDEVYINQNYAAYAAVMKSEKYWGLIMPVYESALSYYAVVKDLA